MKPNHAPPTGPVGPCITSIIDMRDQPELASRMVIEEGSIPGAIGKAIVPALSAAAALVGKDDNHGFIHEAKKKARELDSMVRGPYHGAIHNTQTYLIMSHDKGDGRMVLDASDQLRLDWPGVGKEADFEIGNARLAEATKALGGTYVRNPNLDRRFQTQRDFGASAGRLRDGRRCAARGGQP